MSPDREHPDELSWVLLDRYLAGRCTPTEQARVEAWVRTHPEEGRDLVRLRDALRQSKPTPTEPSMDRMWAAIQARRGERQVKMGTPPPQRAAAQVGHASLSRLGSERRFADVRWRVAGIAAAMVIGAGSLAMWGALSGGWRVMPVREFATIAGTRSVVTLRDGTTLTLGPATRLRVPPAFGVRSRTVELDGEAVFAVVHDARRPFVVHTTKGDVRDVGTTFVVRAYAADSTARVAVAEGEVAVGGASLRAHDAAAIDRAGHLTIHRAVDVARDFGWSTGSLVFEDTPMRDVARELARTYDLTVTIEDSVIAGKVLTATFTDASVDEVLGTVTRVVGAHYARTGREVVIRRGVVPAGTSTGGEQAEMRTAALGRSR